MINDKYNVDEDAAPSMKQSGNWEAQGAFINNDDFIWSIDGDSRSVNNNVAYRELIGGNFSKREWLSGQNTEMDVKSTRVTFSKIMESLAEPDKKYKYLFDSNPCPMFIWDVDTLEIFDCNKESLAKYGYTRDELLCLTIRDLQLADDLHLLDRVTGTEAYGGLIKKQVWRQVNKAGQTMFMEVSGHLIDYHGRMVSFIQLNDLTEKEHALAQLEESQAKLKNGYQDCQAGLLAA